MLIKLLRDRDANYSHSIFTHCIHVANYHDVSHKYIWLKYQSTNTEKHSLRKIYASTSVFLVFSFSQDILDFNIHKRPSSHTSWAAPCHPGRWAKWLAFVHRCEVTDFISPVIQCFNDSPPILLGHISTQTLNSIVFCKVSVGKIPPNVCI